ncbi:hypothetical protein ACF0H5_006095 [Mactra antiquata]
MFQSNVLVQSKVNKSATPVIVTLDIGNSCSGYAYTSIQDFCNDNWTIQMNEPWARDRHVTNKTCTTVLLEPGSGLEKAKYGYDAETVFADKYLDDEHHDCLLFRDIKYELYKDGVDFESTITDVYSGKKRQLCDILLAVIKYFKTQAIDRVQKRFPSTNDATIFWVLTVPSAWKLETTMLYRDLAIESGIPYRQLKLVTEPEACLAYMMQHININIPNIEKTEIANIVSVFDARVMLVDLSGDATTLSVHRVSGDKRFKMVYQSKSHGKGSTQVNEQFLLFLSNLIGEDIIRTLKHDYVDDYMAMYNEFEMEKRRIEPESPDRDTFSFKLPYQIEETFKDQYKDEYKTITQRIKDKSDYRDHVRYVDGRLHVEIKVLKALFDVVLNKIEVYIRNVLQMVPCARVACLMLVGGLAESKMVQDGMKNRFKEMLVLTPKHPELAVMKGAIMLSLLPEIEPPKPTCYHRVKDENIISSICSIQ